MLSLDAKPEDMVAFVGRWFKLMADGRVEAALSELDEPNSYGVRWSTEAIARLISQNFGHGKYLARHPEGPLFTAPEAANGRADAEVVELEDGSGYVLDHNVPLNGEWSDLTAQFEFLRRDRGYAVVLHDLHVL